MAVAIELSVDWVTRHVVQRYLDSHECRPEVSFLVRGDRRTRIRTAEDGSGCLIVLDANYRIEDGLADALNSIDTYYAALVRKVETGTIAGIVTVAYLLAPHLPQLDGGPGYRDTAMPGRPFHPEFRRGFRFGAVCLRPGMTGVELREVLRTIVADATGKTEDG
ncbi:MAG: hypothetical protein F4X12_01845 [Acidobacteriia bacterium]|nr:hypothetical protein [Terriglobia bacterium]